jgi:hypothetical protein
MPIPTQKGFTFVVTALGDMGVNSDALIPASHDFHDAIESAEKD